MNLLKDIKDIVTYHAGATVGHFFVGISTGTTIILDPIIVALFHKNKGFMLGLQPNKGFTNGFRDAVLGPIQASMERFESDVPSIIEDALTEAEAVEVA